MMVNEVRHAGFTNDTFVEEGKQYITLFVETTSFSGMPEIREPDKCEEWCWFDFDQLPEPLFAPLNTLFKQGYCPGSTGA